MRLVLTCTVLTVLLVVLPHVDAWRRRRWVRWPRLPRLPHPRPILVGKRAEIAEDEVCPFTCKRYCKTYDSCTVVCANSCSLEAEEKENKDLKQFPHYFETYDENGDGFLTLKEFRDTLHADRKSSLPVFKFADDNDDGRLSKEEFEAAPYHKEGPDGRSQDDVQPEPEVDFEG